MVVAIGNRRDTLVACFVLYFVILVFVSCEVKNNSRVRDGMARTDETSVFLVDSVFREYFDFFDSARSGVPFYQDDLARAVSFMEKISGIASTADGTDIGVVTVPDIDVSRWRNWYQQHRARLRWDSLKHEPVLIDSAH